MRLSQETIELVIRIGLETSPRRRRRVPRPEEELRAALKRLRAESYEVDLYIRGSWHRRSGGIHAIPERLINSWRLDQDALQADVVLGPGTWMPATGKTPPPELVLRGVRRVA